MLQTVTAKLKIVVSDSQKQILLDTMKAYSYACNMVSEFVFEHHDLKRYHIHEELYPLIRERYQLKSQMAESCIRTVVAAYQSILTNQKEWIKPDFQRPQLDLVWNRDYSLKRNADIFSVNTLKGRIKLPFCKKGFERYFTEECRFGTAKLVTKHGKFFLYVPVTYEVQELKKEEITNVVGIDRGIRFLAVTYDSQGKTGFYDGRSVRQKRAHYKALRKELQQIGTPSSRRRIRAIGQRETRWMHDVNHCISKALTDHYPEGTLFVLEDLTGIRSATERVRTKDRYVSVSWSYYDLEQKLSYKALRNHQLVEKVSPKYTSQTCPKCNHTEKQNRNKHLHLFCCRKCGYRSNDDRIAALNLHRLGIELTVPDAVAEE